MKLKLLFATALIASFSTPAMAAKPKADMLDPSKPEDALEISKRVQCGPADGEPAVYHWSGNVYSRVQGEPDRLLFKGEGMNIRTCVSVDDPKRGKGWRLVSREIMLYLDPKTGEVVRTWDNPWSGEKVDVMHIANDPVNQRPQFPIAADGTPFKLSARREGRWFFQPFEAPLYYHNVLGGEYQDYIGGKYHAMEIFDFAYDADEMLNKKNVMVYPIISWVRISDWMPWMKMRGRQGQMVFNAMGNKLKGYDELPEVLKDEIALNYPDYTKAPPVDDARPNETTWTVFKKKVDAERAAKGEAPKIGH
jgi:Protein of unknown function (DUF1838)